MTNLSLDTQTDDLIAKVDAYLGAGLGVIVAKAGARELLEYAAGGGNTTAVDLRSKRIVCLLQSGLSLPHAERVVSRLFRVPLASARRFMSVAAARYPAEFADLVKQAANGQLANPFFHSESGQWHVELRPGPVRDFVTESIRDAGQAVPRATGGGYYVALSTLALNAARSAVGLDPSAVP